MQRDTLSHSDPLNNVHIYCWLMFTLIKHSKVKFGYYNSSHKMCILSELMFELL